MANAQRNAIARQILCGCVGLLVLFAGARAQACSCASSTLAERVENASVVFTARIVGGTAQFDERDQSSRSYDFEVTETFKGFVGFNRLRSQGSSAMCGAFLQVGSEYLFFSGNKGGFGSCSGQQQLDPPVSGRSVERPTALERLRRWKSNPEAPLVNHWTATEYAYNCVLHGKALLDQRSRGGEIRFNYFFHTSLHSNVAGDAVSDRPHSVTLRAAPKEQPTEAAELYVGERVFTLPPFTEDRWSRHWQVDGQATLALMESFDGKQHISWKLPGEGSSPQETSASTHGYDEAAAQFARCVNAKREKPPETVQAASARFRDTRDYAALLMLARELESGTTREKLHELLGPPDIDRTSQQWWISARPVVGTATPNSHRYALAVSFLHNGFLTRAMTHKRIAAVLAN